MAKSFVKDGEAMINKLKAIQKRSGLTASQWSQKSGVPTDTINKILNGTTKSPGFQTVCSLVLAAGGSVNELLEIKEVAAEQVTHRNESEMNADMLRAVKETYDSKIADLKEAHASQIADLKEYHGDHVGSLEKQIADIKYSRRVVAVAFALLLAFGLVLIAFDVLNGNMGYIVY